MSSVTIPASLYHQLMRAVNPDDKASAKVSKAGKVSGKAAAASPGKGKGVVTRKAVTKAGKRPSTKTPNWDEFVTGLTEAGKAKVCAAFGVCCLNEGCKHDPEERIDIKAMPASLRQRWTDQVEDKLSLSEARAVCDRYGWCCLDLDNCVCDGSGSDSDSDSESCDEAPMKKRK